MAGPSPKGAPIWYQKHMAHHMVGPVSHEDLPGLRHAFEAERRRGLIAMTAGEMHRRAARQMRRSRNIAR